MYLIFDRICDNCGGKMAFKLSEQIPLESDIQEVKRKVGIGICTHSYVINMNEVDEFDGTVNDIVIFQPEDL